MSIKEGNAAQEGIAACAKEIAALNDSIEEINRRILALSADCAARMRRMQDDLAQKQERARALGREAEQLRLRAACAPREVSARA